MPPESKTQGGRKPVRIGKYEVVAHIATGGMGAVYRAVDTELGRPVALKVLAPGLAAQPNMVERFRREARSAAKLRHEHVVTIYEIGEFAGTHFLALEYVDGKDLHDYIQRHQRLRPEEAREILIQAARALDHAHKQGIVHRDIKPSNFLITQKDGRVFVKLTDLGLARGIREEEFRVTNPGSTVGTVDYMAPEQARDSSAADVRSDIYSLGCTFYHMLAGVPPFPEGNLTERLYQHAEKPPVDIREHNADVPAWMVMVLEQMLSKDPADRYQSPAELLQDLEHPEKMRLPPISLGSLAELAKEAGAPARQPSRARVPVAEMLPGDGTAPKSPRRSRKPSARTGSDGPPADSIPWVPITAGILAALVVLVLLLVQFLM
jgi:serine/threonine protein kinase